MDTNDHLRRQFNKIRFALRLRIPFALATMFFGIAGLATNIADVDFWLDPLAGRASTHPLTAFCLFGLGFGVLGMVRFRPPSWRRVVIYGTIAMICMARLMDWLLTGGTGPVSDAVFGPTAFADGRFSFEAALTLGSLSLAAILRHNFGQLGQVFLLIGLALVSNILVELTYGLVFFNGDVSAFTLLGLISACVSVGSVYVHRPLFRVALLMSAIGVQTRVMIAAVVSVPWVCGFYLYSFSGLVASHLDTAIAISVITWVMLLLVLSTSARHEGSDAARRRAEREITEMSRTDALTSVLNRFGMTEVLAKTWKDFQTRGTKYGIVLIDLDYFKSINDTYGHEAGDDVLAEIGDLLRPHLRACDAVARWGGEEFLVLLRIQDRANLEAVSERLRSALECGGIGQVMTRTGQAIPLTASFGISDFLLEDATSSDAIGRADAGLYRAKELGRNRVVPLYQHALAA